MQLKRTMAALIISAITVQNSLIAYADEQLNIVETNNESIGLIDNQDVNETTIENIINPLPDMNSQLDELYNEIGDKLGVNKKYIKELHILAGGTAVYADKRPDIKNDIVVETAKSPMSIYNTNVNYIKADFIECADDKIARPSQYYLPDAIYSVAYDVISIMSQRYYYNRGGYQIYFDALQEDVKQDISFYEAVLLYTGLNEDTVNKFYTAYEKMLYDKDINENIVEEDNNGNKIIKDKFIGILNDIGISSDKYLAELATMLSFDKNLAISDSLETLQESYYVPYKPNYTSRENMMIAAASLCGKVRYVWGGGHSGASYIDGINPMWKKFESLYPDTQTSELTGENGATLTVVNDGFKTCIKPSGSWCPIHGYSNEEYHGGTVNSLQEYIDISADHLNADELLDTKYRDMLSQVDYSNGINIHTLDGLDCSGFASWLYNQITDKYEINSTAKNFTNQNGLVPVEYGDEAYPGDIFAWTNHIVIIVGKVNDNAKAFVTIEQTPNVLKYGVIYYKGAKTEDVELAKQIASEANELIGGINSETEPPHAYCMDSVGIYTVQETVSSTTQVQSVNYSTVDVWFPASDVEGYNPSDLIPSVYDHYDYIEDEDGYIIKYYIAEETSQETTVESVVEHKEQYREIGRFKDEFIDENIEMPEYGKTIKEMYAQDIIQHTINKLPISYVSGYNTYNGSIFDKSKVAENIGINIL